MISNKGKKRTYNIIFIHYILSYIPLFKYISFLFKKSPLEKILIQLEIKTTYSKKLTRIFSSIFDVEYLN